MLIPYGDLLQKYNLKVKGILHVGEHECEELNQYVKYGVNTRRSRKYSP